MEKDQFLTLLTVTACHLFLISRKGTKLYYSLNFEAFKTKTLLSGTLYIPTWYNFSHRSDQHDV